MHLTPTQEHDEAVAPEVATCGLNVLFALPGLHAVERGAEVAFESLASEIARRPGCRVTLIGSGRAKPDTAYRFIHAGCRSRVHFERWPRIPPLRSDTVYEELTYAPRLYRRFVPSDHDVTVTCSYPFTNWVLRLKGRRGRSRPQHVFVTQNGDWPCRRTNSEYRLFNCDGLVCTNPDYYERHRDRWPSALIPNGVDVDRFSPGPADRARLGLPAEGPIVLMVSALVPSKRVLEGIRAVAQDDDLQLVIAGDGSQRAEAVELARDLLPDRFHLVSLTHEQMPDLYRCADALLHMSLDEPFGIVYLEALATGLPVVTHDRAQTRWMMGDVAELVDTDDPTAVIEALRFGLDRRGPADVERRRRHVAKRYRWSVIAGQYCALFERLRAGSAK